MLFLRHSQLVWPNRCLTLVSSIMLSGGLCWCHWTFGFYSSVSFVARCHIKPGEILLVHGASGAVGIAAVQIAKAYGKGRHHLKVTFNLGISVNLLCKDSNHLWGSVKTGNVSFSWRPVVIYSIHCYSTVYARWGLQIDGRVILKWLK